MLLVGHNSFFFSRSPSLSLLCLSIDQLIDCHYFFSNEVHFHLWNKTDFYFYSYCAIALQIVIQRSKENKTSPSYFNYEHPVIRTHNLQWIAFKAVHCTRARIIEWNSMGRKKNLHCRCCWDRFEPSEWWENGFFSNGKKTEMKNTPTTSAFIQQKNLLSTTKLS